MNKFNLEDNTIRELVDFSDVMLSIGNKDKNAERGMKTVDTYSDLKEKLLTDRALSEGQLHIFQGGAKIFKMELPDEVNILLAIPPTVSIRNDGPTTTDVFSEMFKVEPTKSDEHITKQEVIDAIVEAFIIIRTQLENKIVR